MKEVELEKNGEWGPKSVFGVRHVGDIVRVEGELGDAFDW